VFARRHAHACARPPESARTHCFRSHTHTLTHPRARAVWPASLPLCRLGSLDSKRSRQLLHLGARCPPCGERRACTGLSRRPPGTDAQLPSPSAAPDPPTGSPKMLGDPARVLSGLRPLAHGQRWGGPRTCPGQVHCLGRPLVVSCARFSLV